MGRNPSLELLMRTNGRRGDLPGIAVEAADVSPGTGDTELG
jgi:hypothetical protein